MTIDFPNYQNSQIDTLFMQYLWSGLQKSVKTLNYGLWLRNGQLNSVCFDQIVLKHTISMCKFQTYAWKHTFLQGFPGSLSLHFEVFSKYITKMWVPNLCGEIYNPPGTWVIIFTFYLLSLSTTYLVSFTWTGLTEQQFSCSNIVVYAKSNMQFRQQYLA